MSANLYHKKNTSNINNNDNNDDDQRPTSKQTKAITG